MAYALRTNAGPIELVYGQSVVAGGISLSYGSMLAWDDESRAAVGIYSIVEPDAVPDGKIATGSSLEDDNGTIRRVWMLDDAPDVPQPAYDPRGLIATLSGAVDSDGGVAGVDNAMGMQAAMELMPGIYWFFFSQPLPDESYITAPGYRDPAITFDVKVTDQQADYVEITTIDRVTSQPARPAFVCVTVSR